MKALKGNKNDGQKVSKPVAQLGAMMESEVQLEVLETEDFGFKPPYRQRSRGHSLKMKSQEIQRSSVKQSERGGLGLIEKGVYVEEEERPGRQIEALQQ